MSDKEEKTLDTIGKALPIVGACLIFYGFIKLHLFYDQFGIDIIDYLETGEILTSFIDDIWALLIFIGIWLGPQLILGLSVESIPVGNVPRDKPQQQTTTEPEKPITLGDIVPFGLSHRWFRTICFVILVLITAIFYFRFYYFDHHSKAALNALLFCSFSLSIGIFYLLLNADYNSRSSFLCTQLMMLAFIVNTAFSDGYEKVEQPSTFKITLTDSSTVCSSSDTTFIGKTNQYYFLHISSTRNNIVVPVSEVKQFEIAAFNEVDQDTNKTKICLYPF